MFFFVTLTDPKWGHKRYLEKKCTNQSNPQTWSILSWSISSSLVPLFIIKPMGRSFSTPGNEPLWGWFSGSRDLDQDLSCSHYIIIVSQVWDPKTKTLLFNSMARNARAPTCTKRQLLVKLRGPRRLAKSVVLQPPEGLNMQQFNGIVFDDWPAKMSGTWKLSRVDVPVFVDLSWFIQGVNKELVQLVVSAPHFASAGVQYQRDHFQQNSGKYLQHLQDHSTRG